MKNVASQWPGTGNSPSNEEKFIESSQELPLGDKIKDLLVLKCSLIVYIMVYHSY